MVNQVVFGLVTALATLAGAQLNGLPTCAVDPAVSILGGSTCGLTNFQCICESPVLIQSLQGAVSSACSDPADISSGVAAAQSICAPYGGVPTGGPAGASTTVPNSDTTNSVTAVNGVATSPSSISLATATSAPYASGNFSSSQGSTGGVTSNKTATGSPIATGAATKAAAAPAVRDAGLLAGMLAFIGAAVLM